MNVFFWQTKTRNLWLGVFTKRETTESFLGRGTMCPDENRVMYEEIKERVNRCPYLLFE